MRTAWALLLALPLAGVSVCKGAADPDTRIRVSDRESPAWEQMARPPAEAIGSGDGDECAGGPVAALTRPPEFAPAAPSAADQILPINLATALYLSNARPLVIAAAQASEARAAAQLEQARVLWQPNLSLGIAYYDHAGAAQTSGGSVIFPRTSAFDAGAGAALSLGVTDAIFRPLAARRELSAKQFEVQAARNDALLAVAAAFFDVQYARGRLAATVDAATKGEDLVRRVSGLAESLVPEIEIDRARASLLDLQQQVAGARGAWRVSSARLARVLRLNPAAVIAPIEPPHLQVTLFDPAIAVDQLVPIGLTTRPELASQRALVDATLERLRQERLRPLIPSVVLQGRGPEDALNGSLFGGGQNGRLDTWGGRSDVELGMVWTLQNLGMGNRAAVRQRAAEQQQSLIALFET